MLQDRTTECGTIRKEKLAPYKEETLMWAITKLTFGRAKDPALIILFLMGGVLAFFLQDSDIFELFGANVDSIEPVVPKTGIFLGTVILSSLGVMISVFNATSEIPRDINSRLISILLSKPLSRFEYVMGKFLGSLSISLSFGTAWITIMLVSKTLLSESDGLGFWVAIAQYNCLLALIPTCAFATAVSCFFSDMVSMIVTSAYILLSFSMAIAPIVASLSGAVFGKLVLFFYFFFPNYVFFLQNKPGFVGTMACLLYSLSISLIFIIIGVARFDEGDVFSRD